MPRKPATNAPTGEPLTTIKDVWEGGLPPSGTLTRLEGHPAGDPAVDPGLIEGADFSELDRIDAQIAEIRGGLDGGSDMPKVSVYRAPTERNGKEAFLYRCEITDWENMGFSYIAENYGGGDYKVRIYVNGKLVVNRAITIERPKERPAPAYPPAMQPDALASLVSGITQGFERLGAMIAMQQQAQQKAPSMTELLQQMAMMREILAPAVAPAPTANPMDTFKLALDLAERLSDSRDPETGFASRMIEQFGPVVMQAMQAGQQQAPAQLPGPTVAPAAPVTPGNPPPLRVVNPVPEHAPPPARNAEDDDVLLARTYLAIALKNAQANADVEPIAETVASQAPDAMLDIIEADDWWTVLVKIEPNIAPFQQWFTRLREAVLKHLTDDGEPGQDDGKTG